MFLCLVAVFFHYTVLIFANSYVKRSITFTKIAFVAFTPNFINVVFPILSYIFNLVLVVSILKRLLVLKSVQMFNLLFICYKFAESIGIGEIKVIIPLLGIKVIIPLLGLLQSLFCLLLFLFLFRLNFIFFVMEYFRVIVYFKSRSYQVVFFMEFFGVV